MIPETAFLRAVNVGGRGLLAMSDLKRIFERAGCTKVRTIIQSGNVLFAPPTGSAASLRRRIEGELAKLLGKEVVVVYRSTRELATMVVSAPFGAVEAGPDVKLYVGFLAAAPTKVPELPLCLPKEGLEITRMGKRDVFLVSRRVKGRFGFPNELIERALGVAATTRNWSTVAKMVALAQAEPDS
jgi:uncharacterized protein (DUF1697 family)